MRRTMRGWGWALALGLLLGAPVWADGEEGGRSEERRRAPRAGMLDATFGAGGRVLLDIHSSQDVIAEVAVQEDGRIIAAGNSFDLMRGETDFTLVRFLPDGRLDASFGSGGVVTTDLGASEILGGMVLQPDGRILVAGSSGGEQILARYLPDGRLDASFGSGGVVTTDFFGDEDEATALALQRDGRIVVTGRVQTPRSDFDISLARYLPDGRLDSSFGEGGKIVLDFTGGNDEARAVLIQPDRRIVVGGRAGSLEGGAFALARFDRYGHLDRSFGGDGRVTLDLSGGDDVLQDIALQHGDWIVAVGRAFNPVTGWDFAIARFDCKGRLDGRFGEGGVVTVDFFSRGGSFDGDGAQAVTVQKDGRILVAGRAFSPTTPDFGLVRLTHEGDLDESFGTGGRVTTDFPGRLDTATALTLQPDGRLLAAGLSLGDSLDFALARYLGRRGSH